MAKKPSADCALLAAGRRLEAELLAGLPADSPNFPKLAAAVTRFVLRAAVRGLSRPAAHAPLGRLRLFDTEWLGGCCVDDERVLEVARQRLGSTGTQLTVPGARLVELGNLLEGLLALEHQPAAHGKLTVTTNLERKRSGAFYTPEGVVRTLVSRALQRLSSEQSLRVCDPAFGAGAFLLELAEAQLRAMPPATNAASATEQRRRIVASLGGWDVEPLAVAITEAVLWLWLDEPAFEPLHFRKTLLLGDALEAGLSGEFELVIGNPPWVAYAGRAAQPLEPARRRDLAQRFVAFRGYPTLHGCFVERAAKLAPHGRVALLLPSPIADLDGYRAVRHALTETHCVQDGLLEFGQDAFEGVVQPCFGLIADASPNAHPSELPFSLMERASLSGDASALSAPSWFVRFDVAARFPVGTFRELGFQTSAIATRELLLRAEQPAPPFVLPLLQGRDISEFACRSPKLFLNSSPDELKRAGCRLRSAVDYSTIDVIVRQTARFPIATLHSGHAFRNSLLAALAQPPFTGELLVGLLNSTLLRSLHMAARRDARQLAFPQVKIAHLRALPAPAWDPVAAARVTQLVRGLIEQPDAPDLRSELDQAVGDWYGLSLSEQQELTAFFAERHPPQPRFVGSRGSVGR